MGYCVQLSPNGERLLVSDTVAMQMIIFNRSLDTGALTLRQRLDLPGAPDNLEMDVYRGGQLFPYNFFKMIVVVVVVVAVVW